MLKNNKINNKKKVFQILSVEDQRKKWEEHKQKIEAKDNALRIEPLNERTTKLIEQKKEKIIKA
jgi:hypothetical protein